MTESSRAPAPPVNPVVDDVPRDPQGPWQYTESERRYVYATAMRRLFGGRGIEESVSLALVIVWTGHGARRLHAACVDAFQATGRQIARGGR